jgi:hypothetical protein
MGNGNHFQHFIWCTAISKVTRYVPTAYDGCWHISSGFIAESLKSVVRGSLYNGSTTVINLTRFVGIRPYKCLEPVLPLEQVIHFMYFSHSLYNILYLVLNSSICNNLLHEHKIFLTPNKWCFNNNCALTFLLQYFTSDLSNLGTVYKHSMVICTNRLIINLDALKRHISHSFWHSEIRVMALMMEAVSISEMFVSF